jgi:transcriptional regulator with XRE-family HTH domain
MSFDQIPVRPERFLRDAKKGRDQVSRNADVAGIAGRVRGARERAGLSREALAFHSGVSWSAIAQVESGRRTNLRPGTLASLARALGVTIDYLVSGTEPGQTMLRHRVAVYEEEDEFLASTVPFLSGVAERSEAAVAILGKRKITLLRGRLGPEADAVTFADPRDCYRSPGAALAAHREFVETAIADGATWVRILGEPAWRGGKARAPHWFRYEALLNLVFGPAPVSVLCLYDARRLDASMIDLLRAAHPETVEQGKIQVCPAYSDPVTQIL